MYVRDRLANVALLALAVGAWIAVGILVTTRSPSEDPEIQASGAVLIGLAVAITALPLFWLAAFTHRRIAYRGDWTRAVRRAVLAGLVSAVVVLLKVVGGFSLALAAFVVVLAIFVEVILTRR
jgi:hypothetical protein